MLKSEILAEYDAVRTSAAVLDLAREGLLEIRGEDRFRWLQGMVSSDTRDLEQGRQKSQPSYVLDPTGHILSDLTLVNVPASDRQRYGTIFVALPRENVSRIVAVLDRFLISEDVEITDVSASWTCISFQGKEAHTASRAARSIAQGACERPEAIVEVLADRTGSGGLDWYLEVNDGDLLLKALHESRNWIYPTLGAEALELLRVEAGIPKWGLDMDPSVLAPEAGVRVGQVSLNKGCYVGQEVVARIDSRGHTNRALTGFKVFGDRFPIPGDRISLEDSGSLREVGRITSLVESAPAAEMAPIGLGYVRHEHREPGTRLVVSGGQCDIAIEIASLPFFSGASHALTDISESSMPGEGSSR